MNTMNNLEELQIKVAEQISGSPRGIQARFIILNEKWGLKLFKIKRHRDAAYNNQAKCLAVGWAPELGDKIDLPKNNSSFVFGYITEIVEVLPNIDNSNLYIIANGMDKYIEAAKKVSEWVCLYGRDYEPESKCAEWIRQIEKEAEWFFGDAHVFNWGCKNGKWVPIDFGD